KAAGIPAPAVDAFTQAMQQATGADVVKAAQSAESFVARNEARVAQELAAQSRPTGSSSPSPQAPAPQPERVEARAGVSALQGYLMEEQQRRNPAARPVSRAPLALSGEASAALVTIPALALLLVWRRRHRRLR